MGSDRMRRRRRRRSAKYEEGERQIGERSNNERPIAKVTTSQINLCGKQRRRSRKESKEEQGEREGREPGEEGKEKQRREQSDDDRLVSFDILVPR